MKRGTIEDNEIPVQSSEEMKMRFNTYKAPIVVRRTPKGLFLYDIIDIKKEANTPLRSQKTVR